MPPVMLRDRAVDSAKHSIRWSLAHGLPRAMFAVGARRGDPQAFLVAQARDGDSLGPVFDRVRAGGPLVESALGRMTVDHAITKEILASPDFRSGPPQLGGRVGQVLDWSRSGRMHPLAPPSLLVTDPPQHTRYRKLVTRVFTHRAVEALRGRVEQLADELLDGLPTGEPVDLARSYCAELPVTVISAILGVPAADRDRVLAYGAGAAPSLDIGLGWREYGRVERSLAEFDAWLGAHLDRLRRTPGDDLLSQLVHVEEDGVGLTEQVLRSTAGLVLAAGFETTVNLLGNGIALLVQHPDPLALLRERPELWANAVDEVLRHDPPVLLTGRFSTRPTTIGSQPLPAATMITTVIAGANRDPSVFADPDRFDVTRANAREHLSFGHGRHHCLGASLARMEGEVGLRRFFERFPDVELLPGARRRPTRILRGYEELPARLG
jgi:cytochrome P450